MDTQVATYGCGPAALRNALLALGYDVEQETLFRLAGTWGEGTGAREIKRAATRLGSVRVDVINEDAPSVRAWRALLGALAEGSPCVLCVDKGEHWVAAVGVLGNWVIVVDSAASLRRHVDVYSRDEVDAMWTGYGLALSPKED